MLRIAPDFCYLDDPVAVHDDILTALRKVPIFPGTPTPVLPVTVVVPLTVLHTLTYCAYPHDNKTDRPLDQMMLEVYAERWGLHAFIADDDDEIAEAKADDALLRLLYSHPAAVARGGTKIFMWPDIPENVGA